jgi:alpha-L-fucosidase
MAFRDLRAARFVQVGGGQAAWTAAAAGRQLDVPFTKPVTIAGVRIEEDIEHGQAVARFSVHGEEPTGWRELARGATIGYARIERFAPVTVTAIRVVIEEAVAPVARLRLRTYAAP